MPTNANYRIIAALLVSLLLHAALVLWQLPAPAPKPPPRLEVKLPVPAPSTPPAILEESNTLPEAVEAPPPPPPPAPQKAPGKATRLAQKQENTLLRKLSEFVVYPPDAIEAGHEGTVHLLVTLKADGTFKSASVAASSGHAELDQAALAAVGRLPRLDAGGKSEFIFPLTFRLQ